jgi:hypothetical protein
MAHLENLLPIWSQKTNQQKRGGTGHGVVSKKLETYSIIYEIPNKINDEFLIKLMFWVQKGNGWRENQCLNMVKW